MLLRLEAGICKLKSLYKTMEKQRKRESSNLKRVGDKLLFDSVRYRVMARKPYYLYGYMEYHLVQDYEGSINAN